MLGETNVDRLTRRRERTRLEILEAAWSVVRETSWAGLTQRAVAERVGMRAPSLYSHFASKLDIVDAMFAQAWEEYDVRTAHLQERQDGAPRAVLHALGRGVFDAFAADPDRYALMAQRPVPGFVPSPDAYAPAVRSLERLHIALARIGVHDPVAPDLWTALISGLVSQQIANDPGGDRWSRLVPRAVDMFADELGVPGDRRS
jgi:AcrR family transcriptional regulator